MFQPSFTLLQLYALAKFSDFPFAKWRNHIELIGELPGTGEILQGHVNSMRPLAGKEKPLFMTTGYVARADQTNPKPKAKSLLAAGTL